MKSGRRYPADVAKSLAQRGQQNRWRTEGAAGSGASSSTWRRETFTLSRLEARAKARQWFDDFPKAAYMTEIESWRELSDGSIEFTIRRLPTAD